MTDGPNQAIERKLDAITDLLRHLVAIELAQRGVTQEAIAKRLHVANATVVDMLRGIKERRDLTRGSKVSG